MRVPSRVVFFAWTVVLGKILTADPLRRRGFGLVWLPVGDAFIPLRFVCVMDKGRGAAFSGIAGRPSLPFVKSLVGAECACV